jgi:hypothetical protein
MACDTPFHVNNPRYPIYSNDRQVPVPCGKCPACLSRRTSVWTFRLKTHAKNAISSHFITLTYDTRFVPISSRGFLTLDKRDVQLYFKRLRKLHGKNHEPLKYYLAGEYGSKTFRPHYHIILFNANIELIHKAWDKGEVHIGELTEASAAYTAKYINKGKIIPMHKNDDRLPEFSLMSKKLGLNYLSEKIIRYHRTDIERNFITLEDGKKISMPRYFREKIWTEQERRTQADKLAEKFKQIEDQKELEYYTKHQTLDGYQEQKDSGRAYRITSHQELAAKGRDKI